MSANGNSFEFARILQLSYHVVVFRVSKEMSLHLSALFSSGFIRRL